MKKLHVDIFGFDCNENHFIVWTFHHTSDIYLLKLDLAIVLDLEYNYINIRHRNYDDNYQTYMNNYYVNLLLKYIL